MYHAYVVATDNPSFVFVLCTIGPARAFGSTPSRLESTHVLGTTRARHPPSRFAYKACGVPFYTATRALYGPRNVMGRLARSHLLVDAINLSKLVFRWDFINYTLLN